MIKPEPVITTKPFVNLLLYGPPGVGKTTLAATAQKHPDMKNVLFLNFEGGLLSVGSVPGLSKVNIKTVGEVEEVFWNLVNKAEGYGHFQTVVIDSGSELQTLDLEHTVAEAFKSDKTKRSSIDEVWQDDYGEMTTRLKRVFRWFRDAPFHVIITALDKENFGKTGKNTEPKLLEVVPSFTKQLGKSIRGYCDFVWYMGVDDEGNRCLLTCDTGAFKAKTRGQEFAKAIGPVVKNPDLCDLYNILLKTEGKGE